MAITKLRLQQIQDEVLDFGDSATSYAELGSFEAAPETLHDIMRNLVENLNHRFGQVDMRNYYGEEATAGVLASRNDASELLIKQAGAANIKIDGAQDMQLLAAGEMTSSAAGIRLDSSAEMHRIAAEEIVEISGNITEEATDFAGTYTGGYAVNADNTGEVVSKQDLKLQSSLAKTEVLAATELTASAGSDALISAVGNLKETAASMNIEVSGAIVETAGSIDADYTGAASIVAAGTGEMKANGLLLSSSADNSVHAQGKVIVTAGGQFDVDAESLDADFLQGASIEAGADSEFITTAGKIAINANGDLDLDGGAQVLITAVSELSASAVGMEFLAGAGFLQATGAGVALTADTDTFDMLAEGRMELHSNTAEIHFDAEDSFLQYDDKFRREATADATAPLSSYYNDGIKLAEDKGDWLAWEAAFGDKPILRAIAEAAAGSESAARFVGVASGVVSANTEALSSSLISFKEYSNSINGVAYTSGAHTVADYTAAEMNYSVEVYVNGQRLAQTEDFAVTNGSGAAFADGGTSVDVQIKFALEADDLVEIIVK